VAQLGEFGREELPDEQAAYLATEADEFTFHGDTFHIPAVISALPLLRFAKEARDLDAETRRLNRAKGRARSQADRDRNLEWEAELRMREQASLYEYLRAMLPEDEWEPFSTVAASVGSDVTELMSVANKIIAAVTSRPTRLPGGSPAGQLTTTSGSLDALPSPGGQRAIEVGDDTFTLAPVAWQDGRPATAPQEPAGTEEQAQLVPVSDEEVAAALRISPRDAQMQRWRAEMVPVEEIDSVP
jgi:hypothetical protein